jgi:AcrR family transcriptional regulator
MTARSEQKERRREQILKAGLDEFALKGLAAAKVADIAKAADMSVGLLFHYFDSKERLYMELVKNGIERSTAMLEYGDGEPLLFFERISRTILGGMNSFTAKMFMLMSAAADSDILPEKLRTQIREENLRHTAAVVRLGQTKGTIRMGEPLALSSAFWGAILGACQIALRNPDYPKPSPDWILDMIKSEFLASQETAPEIRPESGGF